MQESLRNQLQRIEQIHSKITAQECDVIAVGLFQALIDLSYDLTGLNYAVPVEPLETKTEIIEVVSELREVFRERDRILRVEFTEALWSTLPTALEAAGLRLEVSYPMMLCTPADFQPFLAQAVQVQLLTADDKSNTLATYLSVRHQGFDYEPAEPPTVKEIAELREQLQTGSRHFALAYLDSIPAGVGYTRSLSGVCELIGVVTLPALRRRGVAATLSSFLVKDHFEAGGDLVWLAAKDGIARSTYERIGFRSVSSRLNYIDAIGSTYKHC